MKINVFALLATAFILSAGPSLAADEDFTRCLHESVDRIPLRDCKTVLQELANLRHRYRHGEDVKFPRVMIHTRSGKDFFGFVLKMGVYDNTNMVEVALIDEASRSYEPVIALINVGEIDAVSIMQVDQLQHFLSFGDAPLPDPSEAPTKLEIKRKCARFGAILSEIIGAPVTVDVDWTGFPDGSVALRNLGYMMSAVHGELADFAEDSFTRGELAKKLHTITYAAGDKLAAHINKGNLSITAPIDAKNAAEPSRSALHELIQKSI